MKVIDNEKYFELSELKEMLKQQSWLDSWNGKTIYIDNFIKFLEKEEKIEEAKQIEKIEISYAGDIEEKIFYEESDKPNHRILWDAGTELLINKINEIIDKLNELEEGK